MASLIDCGVNLSASAFRHDRPEVLERAWQAGLEGMILIGSDLEDSRRALALSELAPARLFSTAGVHPHQAKTFAATTSDELVTLAAQPAVVALGEMGLDFNRDYSPRPQQEAAFQHQLELACRLNLPIYLHQRDAHERFMALIEPLLHDLPPALLHCFTGSGEELSSYLEAGFYIGVTGWICDERRGGRLQELVVEIPADRLLLETDAPYLLPRDLEPRPSDRRNEPAYLPHVAAAVARHRHVPLEELANQTTANARRLFRLPPTE